MATLRKIEDGSYLISWTGIIPNQFGKKFQKTVNLEEVNQTCHLSFTPSSSECSQQTSTLSIRFIPNPTADKKPQIPKPELVLAIRNGVQQEMQEENLRWTTTFSGACACGNTNFVNSFFEILIKFNSTPVVTESNRVLSYLLNLWETKTLADVTFKFEDKQVQAHTLIIASGSPVLAVMFQHDFKEKLDGTVEIKDIKSTVFEKMLRFFYTGDADMDIVDVADLLIAANMYGVDALKEDCALYMGRNLTVDNVIGFLVLSHIHETPSLQKSSLEFIAHNGEAIVSRKDWEDLMKNYPKLCLEAVKSMVLDKK